MTIFSECYGIDEAVISCGFCGAYVCEECYMRHLVTCGPDDDKQKLEFQDSRHLSKFYPNCIFKTSMPDIQKGFNVTRRFI
ncbi:unnamed protein product, partial [Rotaria sp. Silwood2]